VRGVIRRNAIVPRSWGRTSQRLVVLDLVLLTVFASLGIAFNPDWVTPAVYLLIGMLGAFLLRLRGVLVLTAAITLELLTMELTGWAQITPGTLVVIAVALVALVSFASNREGLGLQGAPSELMLVDLRDRLAAYGRVPSLPPGWRVDTAVRSAHAEAFSGDFMVAARGERGRLLEIVLVDVSGKGQEAGVRSLLLSGAFGGLLGAMPREEFLAAANAYLLDQSWEEGFATAVHVAVRLDTGQYWISTAGHPPAVHVHAGSGSQEIIDTVGGPVLGVIRGLSFLTHVGSMDHGDTLVMYTDGVVEVPGYDLDLGIDRLMGVVEKVVATGRGDAEAVMVGVHAAESDDRALVLVHRD
jgi:hypothetical protein